ncbi:hypothetical protein GCM10009557_90210 [Virgisporangium ochraceum]|uniref:JAB domain-containing protein n=1 Tax=Virgisporangium ochraceum TaxID=65505 RepID=A0A8J4A5K7_9ACTN|nr:Mov34/MPN/PAD-1 family protein [Virgisporangium ochraceum]GIJ75318.1 hypothetical protein Voc01_102350 [Virgisporangium ochraceum]
MVTLTEVCFLLDARGAVLWSDSSSDPSALPDSRDRWTAIWAHRDALAEVAHSHPRGPLAFSATDLSTMDALDAALGRPLGYAVVTPENLLRRRADGTTLIEEHEPAWVALLRGASGLEAR